MVRAPRRCPRTGGFTLLETLVTLMVMGLAAMLMFQMLDGYRIAQRRVAATAGEMDRAALFEAWLLETVHGLWPVADEPMRGRARAFEGVTLNPLYGSSGAPTRFAWAIEEDAEAAVVVYAEEGEERWRLPMRGGEDARFLYFDASGKAHPEWPPAQGSHPPLPAGIALARGGEGATQVRFAAVLGPRAPIDIPFTLEQE